MNRSSSVSEPLIRKRKLIITSASSPVCNSSNGSKQMTIEEGLPHNECVGVIERVLTSRKTKPTMETIQQCQNILGFVP